MNVDSAIEAERAKQRAAAAARGPRKYSPTEDNIYSDGALDELDSNGSMERGPWQKQRNDLKYGYYSDSNTGSLRKHGAIFADPRLRKMNDDSRSKNSNENLSGRQKRDSETNTDQASMMRKGQGVSPAGSSFGFRRPLSTLSTASSGSNRSTGSRSSSAVGSRLAKTGIERGDSPSQSPRSSSYDAAANGRSYKTSGSSQTYSKDPSGMGPEAYSSSTLDRKKKNNLVTSKTQTGLSSSAGSQTEMDAYKSNTLGRRRPDGSTLRERLFGSRSSLNSSKSAAAAPSTTQSDTLLINSTIISNPHATLSKEAVAAHRQQMQQNGMLYSGSRSHDTQSAGTPTSAYGIPGYSNYLTPAYSPSGRPLSGVSNPTSPVNWLKNSPTSGNSVPFRMAMSETESMESISSAASSIHASIQQARAHGIVSRNILHQREPLNPSLHRSNSIKSTQSEKVYSTVPVPGGELPRTNSFTDLSPEQGDASSPTPSNSSQSSSRFTYPLTSLAQGMPTSHHHHHNMNRSSTSSAGIPYGGLMSMARSKDDDRKFILFYLSFSLIFPNFC